MKRQSEQDMRENLLDAGCDENLVERCCELACQAKQKPVVCKEQIRLLCQYRKELLCQLHGCQEKLDCLDYLLCQLREQSSDTKDCKKGGEPRD